MASRRGWTSYAGAHVLASCIGVPAIAIPGCLASGPAPTPPAPPPAQPTANPPVIAHEIIDRGGESFLRLTADGQAVIGPGTEPLWSKSDCRVTMRSEPIAEGVKLRFELANETSRPAAMPRFAISGVTLPLRGSRIIDASRTVSLKGVSNPREARVHPGLAYPRSAYSPVLGVMSGERFLAAMFMADAHTSGFEVHLGYRHHEKRASWDLTFTPAGPVEARKDAPPVALLESGQTRRFDIAVTIAASTNWVEAYRPYRDFFQHTYGRVRYQRDSEPILALSMSTGEQISPDNPKGYSKRSSGDGEGRLDLEGWTGFHDRMKRETRARGFDRLMIWQAAGSHRQPSRPMSWEITSSWSPIMNQTADELRRLVADGFTLGFWMGRFTSVSEGFNTHRRHGWNADDPGDFAAAFREIDRACELGVRMIGMDDTSTSLYADALHPGAATLYSAIFPRLYERYPEMKWIIEPAACDFLHLWGSSFIWDMDISGPPTFADYVAPGNESHAAMKRERGSLEQSRLDQHIRWGYVPIVFNQLPKIDLRVPGADPSLPRRR